MPDQEQQYGLAGRPCENLLETNGDFACTIGHRVIVKKGRDGEEGKRLTSEHLCRFHALCGQLNETLITA